MAKAKAITSGFDDRKQIVSAQAAVVADLDIVVINGRVTISTGDYVAAEAGSYVVECDAEVPKVAATAIVEGDTAYWDATNSVFTNVAGTNVKCGYFTEAAAAADTVAQIHLDNSVNL